MNLALRRTVPVLLAPLLVVASWSHGYGQARRDAVDVTRPRLVVETDAGGDPDDEQSLVRFLLYANEWDVEAILANREKARDGENLNPERTGLGIVQRLIGAYGECHSSLIRHDPRFPSAAALRKRTIAGYGEREVSAAVARVIEIVDAADPRPVWWLNWGTDDGSTTSSFVQALDRVRRERSAQEYARFKSKIRIICHGNIVGNHATSIEPPLPLLVDTFRPAQDGKRWYHRFSAITARAGGFDVQAHVLKNHGPLGAMYPLNSTHPQKEGDTPAFLYLVPTGMNDPEHPEWGSWAGRYGPNPEFSGKPYYWANQTDDWQGSTHRENTLRRWATDLQNDFRARLDWCVQSPERANHAPRPIVNDRADRGVLAVATAPGAVVSLSAAGTTDPENNPLDYEWWTYTEAGSYRAPVRIEGAATDRATVHVPSDATTKTIHIVLTVRDRGVPPMAAYRRVVISVATPEK